MGNNRPLEKKRKKKKGRPSLLDLQRRSIKQQQQQQQQQQKFKGINKKNYIKKSQKFQNPNSVSGVRRSTRRNPNPNSDDEDSGGRREKELKLVLDDEEREDGESRSGGEISDEGSPQSNHKKRKIGSISRGSGLDNEDKEEKRRAAGDQTGAQQGPKVDDGPVTPLPDKKLLLFILDRLQKKDTYGVFAEPVDPDELPDYHEVIEHPMDFGTVRKNLADGSYANLEQFEKDIFLICSNAMQYNAPDTIYFRQARSIQELAKKNFENLRQDSDDNEPEPQPQPQPQAQAQSQQLPEPKRRGRPPTKNLKRPPGRPPLERANSDFSEATLATSGGNSNRSSNSRANNDLRKGPPLLEKYGSADLFAQALYGSRNGESYVGWSSGRYDRIEDMAGSAVRGTMRHGRKVSVLDENKRNTYKHTCALSCREEASVLTTFDGERKQLIAVGLHTEFGYARSLARFAARLGPVAWKVASKKIERCVPTGVKFGPGWVGDSEADTEKPTEQQPAAVVAQAPVVSPLPGLVEASSAPTRGMVGDTGEKPDQNSQGERKSETQASSTPSKLDDGSSKVLSPSASSVNDAPAASFPVTSSNGAGSSLNAPEVSPSPNINARSNMLNSGIGAVRPVHPFQMHQSSNNQTRVNGLNGSYGLIFAAQMGKIIGATRPTLVNFQSSPPIVTVTRTETQSSCPSTADNNGCGEAKSLENSSETKPSDPSPSNGPHQKVGSAPPDLNVGFQSPGSPASARAESVQPDLALQL